MSDFDSPWKEALDVYFGPFMAFFFPLAHAEIDWDRGFKMLDKELQRIAPDAEQGRRVVDKLVQVWRLSGKEEWVLVHVEVQSQEEPDFGERMYVYNYRLFDRYHRMVVSLAILGDDRIQWRPDGFGYSLWGCELGFRFPAVKLLDYAADAASLETNPNPFAMVVLAHLKTLETRQDSELRHVWKLRLVKGLYARGLNPNDVRQLFRLVDWIMELPKPLDTLFSDEIREFEKEKEMPYVTSVERLGREAGLEEGRQEGLHQGLHQGLEQGLHQGLEQGLHQGLEQGLQQGLHQGLEQGLEQGLQQGLQQGLEQGLKQGLLAGIELALKLKFGTVGLLLVPEIQQIADVDLLRAVHQAIESAAHADELRRIWSPRST